MIGAESHGPDFFLCNRELLSSTSHYLGTPPFQSIPVHHPTTTSSPPLTSLTNTLFSIGEQWNFYFATDPRLKLHGLYNHKLLSHPPPHLPQSPTRSFLTHATVASSPRLLHSTRSPSQNNHAPHPHLFSLLHLFTPTHAHRHFSLSLRHHSFPFCRQHAPNTCRSPHEPSLSLSLSLLAPCPAVPLTKSPHAAQTETTCCQHAKDTRSPVACFATVQTLAASLEFHCAASPSTHKRLPDLAASIYHLNNCSSPNTSHQFNAKCLGGLFP